MSDGPTDQQGAPLRHEGPMGVRRSTGLRSTADQRLLDENRPQLDTHTDVWRVLRIQSEFVEGFGALAELGPAVSVFGSARVHADEPEYALGLEVGRLLVE